MMTNAELQSMVRGIRGEVTRRARRAQKALGALDRFPVDEADTRVERDEVRAISRAAHADISALAELAARGDNVDRREAERELRRWERALKMKGGA